MSSNAWINVGVGILFAVAVVVSGGTATAALFAFSLGATASSLVLGPDTPDQEGMRPDELQLNQSSEAKTVPVVFGTSRLSANFIRVDENAFTSEALFAAAVGGKGGGGDKQQTGFSYFVPISYGICMGQIDALVRVLGSPGLDVMADFSPGGLEFGDTPETFDITFQKTVNDQTYIEGGSCTFYPGSPTQGTATTTDMNHRDVCWLDFPLYRIDGSPSPRSLLFEIRRLPKVVDDAGDPIANFPTRASTDSNDPEYLDANPAAIAWEIHQNATWGKGMTTDNFDVESFRLAADYYQRARLGLSTALGKTSITQLMGRLRDIFGLWVWWDGEKLRARCIHDRTTAYSPRPRLQAYDVIGDPQFNRPSLSGTFNEIRLEFTNRENNWQKEIATAQDLAHVETIGGVRTQTIDGSEIGTRRAAELLAHTMLRQMAYPSATAQIRVRRTYSGLQPGSFVEFLWDEWRETGMATTFWRVIDVEDDDQGQEGVTISLMEDHYATAIDGELADGDFTAPVPTIDNDIPLVNDDLVFGSLTDDRTPGSIEPIILWEPNSYATTGARRIVVGPTREKGFVQSVSLAWKRTSEEATNQLGISAGLPINGTIVGAIPADGPLLSRGAAGEFEILLEHAINAPTFEAATGLVMDDSDHFAALTGRLEAILVIGDEIFRVGHAEETAPGVMTVRTYVRAELGSTREAHSAGAPAMFFASFSPALLTPAEGMPLNASVQIAVTPNMINSQLDRDAETVVTPAGGKVFSGASVRPFAPELIQATRAGTTWTLTIRPRAYAAGTGTRQDLEDDAYTTVAELTGLSLRFEKDSGGSQVTVPASSFATPPFTQPADLSVDSLTWIPDTGAAGTGILIATVTFDANPTALLISGVRNGLGSITPLSIPQPT